MTPETSTTLLRNIADADSARWPEFVSRYRPMMAVYLAAHFPALDSDDLIQETFAALFNVLPRYRYDPGETGRFRNYLTGILRKRALKQCERDVRERTARSGLKEEQEAAWNHERKDDDAGWCEAVLEIAMRQLLDDDRIPGRSKQIFQQLVVDGAKPDYVARAYGTSRNNVDKTKSRMISRVRRFPFPRRSGDTR